MIKVAVFALLLCAGVSSHEPALTYIGNSHGWLVYLTPDNRIVLVAQQADRYTENITPALVAAFAQKQRRDYVRKDST